MKQPWIHKPITDCIFILSPAFLVCAIAVVFQSWLARIEESHSFYTWLFLIVFVDVAHVYATLFKTYFVKSEFAKRRMLLVILPIICFVIGLMLFSFGSAVFWSVLAYIAVFHFIRQQYGFMRLYSRTESFPLRIKWFDNLVIYAATGFPMLYWFLSPNRNFNWFVSDEFFQVKSAEAIQVLSVLYALILSVYLIRTIYVWTKFRWFNVPKNAIIVGTALSWFLGIVWFNNDLVFTLLNVVSHGIPYMALVFFGTQKSETRKSWIQMTKGIAVYVGILVGIAFFEEYFWEIFVWNDHFTSSVDASDWQILLVPLLTVPQFTHYLLDGFIWKSGK